MNISLDSLVLIDGKVLLSDFSIAYSDYISNKVLGTYKWLKFASPEARRGVCNHKSDL